MSEQQRLFDPAPSRVVKRIAQPAAVRWSKYTLKARQQCDFCVLNCRDDPKAPIPRMARYVRRTKDKAQHLCLSHANDQRVIDGLAEFKPRNTP